jgi:Protein of unknown function (DUF2924)
MPDRDIPALSCAQPPPRGSLLHRWNCRSPQSPGKRALFPLAPRDVQRQRYQAVRLAGRTGFELQERELGGLSAATGRLLCGQGPAPVRRRRALSPGTVLIRKWHGVGHQVTIIEKGVLFRGERYRSMSEVAHLITGARWSGPRFFGVKA